MTADERNAAGHAGIEMGRAMARDDWGLVDTLTMQWDAWIAEARPDDALSLTLIRNATYQAEKCRRKPAMKNNEPLTRAMHCTHPEQAWCDCDWCRFLRSQTLTGREAIEYAQQHGGSLSKYADPIEPARDGLTVDEARMVAAEDPGLIYLVRAVEG